MDDTSAKDQELKELENERQAHITKLFVLMIEIAFIFGLPAFLVLILGKNYGTLWYWIGFPIAVIFSWGVVIILYRRLHKKLSRLDTRIKELKDDTH